MSYYIKNLNKKEATLLNFSWRLGDFSISSSPYIIYAASTEGIYRIVNTDEIISRYRKILTKLAKYVVIPMIVIFIGLGDVYKRQSYDSYIKWYGII